MKTLLATSDRRCADTGPRSTPLRLTMWTDGLRPALNDLTTEIARRLGKAVRVRPAVLEGGLTDELLEHTDVLVWPPRQFQPEPDNQVLDRIYRHVLHGMGLVVLQPGAAPGPLARLLSTTEHPAYRRHDRREVVWSVASEHPIAQGVPNPMVIDGPHQGRDASGLPEPDELVFVSSHGDGKPASTGRVFLRGQGRIFYFSPGDQNDQFLRHPEIQRVVVNAIRWAAPPGDLR